MKIRTRLLFAIGMTLIIAAIGVYYFSSSQMMNNIVNLEAKNAREDALRVNQYLKSIVGDVHSQTIDWASWDDSCQYMLDKNSSFIDSNMDPSNFVGKRIDNVMMFGNDQKVVYELASGRTTSLPKIQSSIVQKLIFRSSETASKAVSAKGLSGVILINGFPVAISARAITPTNRDLGKTQGTLVFLRYLDSAIIKDLRAISRQEVKLIGIGDLELVQQSLPKSSGELTPNYPVIRVINSEELSVFSVTDDIFGKPAFILQTDIRRTISLQGAEAIRVINYNLLLIALAFGAVVVFVIEKFAISRVLSLSKQVEQIESTTLLSFVELPGKDELSFLANRINQMLMKMHDGSELLRASEANLRHQNENLERAVYERTKDIEHQSLHDKLTGLPNRALYMDRLTAAIRKTKRNKFGTAALFLDLDSFKLINDSLGHDKGDVLLKVVGQRLASALRPGDTVARMGGDEFTIILEEVADIEGAEVVADRILASLKKPIMLGNMETFALASIGIAFSTDNEMSAEDLLKNADCAMYWAKANGKANFVTYDTTMEGHAAERLELEASLRKALSKDEIYVQYQPLVDLSTNSLIGAEALARWKHPEKGNISPGEFIPIAEDTGLIIQIGYWILEHACIQAKTWSDAYNMPDFVMSVNMSGKQLQRPDVINRVREIIERTGITPANLKIEITETVLMNDRVDVAQKLAELKMLGIKLALDDFGTGYSSLSSLQTFPIDTLKIDRSFISRLGDEDGALAIVEAILALAKTMSMSVIGEGVETAGQQEIIRNLGCQTGQGYLFDKPLSTADFEDRMLKAQNLRNEKCTSENQDKAA